LRGRAHWVTVARYFEAEPFCALCPMCCPNCVSGSAGSAQHRNRMSIHPIFPELAREPAPALTTLPTSPSRTRAAARPRDTPPDPRRHPAARPRGPHAAYGPRACVHRDHDAIPPPRSRARQAFAPRPHALIPDSPRTRSLAPYALAPTPCHRALAPSRRAPCALAPSRRRSPRLSAAGR
jgi:hypothetical protein